jgi:hypothetical protein
MGRYYDINIGDGLIRYTSPDGDANGALNVELDITVLPNDITSSNSYARVWGIPLEQLGPNYNLINKNVSVSGGFSAGLPLAKSNQKGVLGTGQIFQAFGNWIGTDMTLDLVFLPGVTAPTAAGPNPTPVPKNLVLNWKKGQSLEQPLRQALQTAFSSIPIGALNISSKLIAVQDQIGYHANLDQFSLYIRRITQDIINSNQYAGVSIAINGGKFVIDDGTSPQSFNGTIAFEDLIGQPTWISSNTIQWKCPMRADIKWGDMITLPTGPVTYGANSYPGINQQVLFKGKFQVVKIRHVGNFRQPDAASWVTIFDGVSNPSGSATSNG